MDHPMSGKSTSECLRFHYFVNFLICFYSEVEMTKMSNFLGFLVHLVEAMAYHVYITKDVKVTTILWYMITKSHASFVSFRMLCNLSLISL